MVPVSFLGWAPSESEIQNTTNSLTGNDLTIRNQIARALDP